MSNLRVVLKAGSLYFLAVFVAGSALGTLRVLWVSPRFGARAAELIEMPAMLAVMIAATVWIVRRGSLPEKPGIRLGMGGVALALLLLVEFTLVLRLRGLSLAEYAAAVDPVRGAVYYSLLGVFALLPSLVTPAAGRRPAAFALLAVAVAIAAAFTYESFRRDVVLERARVSGAGQIAHTKCGPIEYASVGKGPAVLAVHGAGGGYDQGLAFAQELADEGFRVVTMSRFGYLKTPLPQDASPAAQADAHACLLDTLGIERASIVGVSAGAPSTMQFALRHPQRANAMLLLVPLAYAPRAAAAPPSVARFMYERAVKSDFLFWAVMKARPSLVVRTILATPPEALAAADAEEHARVSLLMRQILPLSERQEGLINDARIAAALPRYDLERVTVPTLLISLEDDLYGTYDSARYTAAHIPAARFIGYASGGHVWVGHHREIVSEMKTFLSRRS